VSPQNPQLDPAKFFAGGKPISPFIMSLLPKQPYPDQIYSANLTPDVTGLQGWTAADIVKAVKQGLDREGNRMCPPMPFGPDGAFGGMTDEDANDIAAYIVGLPAVVNKPANGCFLPP